VTFDVHLIFVFLAVGLAFVFAALLVGSFIRPRRMQPEVKNATYECGETPEGKAWYNFNPRFYMLALVFLIFDVEVVATFPAVVVLRKWAEEGRGFAAYLEVLLFVVILATGLVFLWIRGDLEWMKAIESSGVPESAGASEKMGAPATMGISETTAASQKLGVPQGMGVVSKDE